MKKVYLIVGVGAVCMALIGVAAASPARGGHVAAPVHKVARAACNGTFAWGMVEAINTDTYTTTSGAVEVWSVTVSLSPTPNLKEFHPLVLGAMTTASHLWWRGTLNALYNNRYWLGVTMCGPQIAALSTQGVTLTVTDNLHP